MSPFSSKQNNFLSCVILEMFKHKLKALNALQKSMQMKDMIVI